MIAWAYRMFVCAATAVCVWTAGANVAYAGGGHGGGHGGGGGGWHGGGGGHGGGWHGGGWHGGGHVHGSVSIYAGPYWGWGWYGYPYYWGYPYYAGYPYYSAYPYYGGYAYSPYYAPYAGYAPAASVPYVERSPATRPVYWYYCTALSGYYPYVKNCSKQWMRVLPSDVPAAPNASPPSAPSGDMG